eukprot:GHVO01069287.1.p1 GENE.GHVO01069287.1~~GHVO01069287.1.p1  ORF type:complete len:123 (+),score=6.87 GHVO01069287.1:35-403(+)
MIHVFSEPMVAFRVGAPFRFIEAGRNAQYGNDDKSSLTQKLIKSELVHCPDRGSEESGTTLDISDVQSCGGVFRLPYYSMLRNKTDLIRSSYFRYQPRLDSAEALNCILLDRLRPYMVSDTL